MRSPWGFTLPASGRRFSARWSSARSASCCRSFSIRKGASVATLARGIVDMAVIARPEPGEFAPAFAGYVARAPVVSDAVRQLAFQGDALVSFLSPLSEAQAAFRY